MTWNGPTISSSPLFVLSERPIGVELRPGPPASVLDVVTGGGGGSGGKGRFEAADAAGGAAGVCWGLFTNSAGEGGTGVEMGGCGDGGVAAAATDLAGAAASTVGEAVVDVTGAFTDCANGGGGSGGGSGGSDCRVAVMVEVVKVLLESERGAATGRFRSV